MVALQILVLTVGVRILLGELRLNLKRFSLFFEQVETCYEFSRFLRSKNASLREQGKYSLI